MGTQKTTFNHPFLLPFSVFLVFIFVSAESTQYSITGYDPEDLRSEDRVTELFRHWREKHRKIYIHVEETLKRFENFKRNLRYVIESNSGRAGFAVGLNRFADLSNEEFREKYTRKVKKPVELSERWHTRRGSESECHAPRSLDWRKKGAVTAVKDQGDCGSCWAFSTTGAIEGINAISTGELISLSEQELLDCDKTNDGCDGGYMDYAFGWVINSGGIDTEANYPYTGVDGTCNSTNEANKIVSIDGYENVAESEEALLCAAVNQPISVGIQGSAIDFQLYTGGIYDGDCSSNPDDIDHAVLIVGYGSEGGEDYWIVKNSWGTDWGMSGYAHIRRNTNLKYGVCAINAMASYPTQTYSAPSPQPSPSPPPPSQPPPPPPPPPSPPPPPPPPPPSPTECGEFSYCPTGQTCCCLYEMFNFCLINGCCDYTNAVCCTGSDYCCPSEYPICDVPEGLCLRV
ncbi:hypothetical protein Cgig2_028823 [Carnegiea gigantea]|uniref:Low-temperature-induced cysteine proteinase-like n=1 Tax=Carnegiea gigantea TaxID=171969 RepID=A0A9Q1KSP6_9CARY|nr:hypothetical protein Cgig2_028823 [Carnegiea gigantea]